MSYNWLDLGDLFWPRWVKKGHCESSLDIARQDDNSNADNNSNNNSFDCSWPRGMKCMAGKSKVLHILRWHCRLRRTNSGKSKHKCRWYKVPYPVTESCMCGSN